MFYLYFQLIAPAALLGIKSSIGTTFNLFPRLAQDILNAVEKNDVATARALQEKLSLAVEAHTVEGMTTNSLYAFVPVVRCLRIASWPLPRRPVRLFSLDEHRLKSL